MPTFNRREFIRSAIDAILEQDYQDWELIIQNGGESVADLMPDDTRIHLFEEKDNGITDAMNRAMKKATGDLFVWANDDDQITRGSFSYIVKNLKKEWCYGYILMSGMGSQHTWGTDMKAFGEPSHALDALKQNNFVPQPSVYWTRHAYEVVGEMDEEHDLTSDYAYWIKLWSNFEPQFMDRIMAKYSIHPDSITVKNTAEQMAQARKTSEKYGGQN